MKAKEQMTKGQKHSPEAKADNFGSAKKVVLGIAIILLLVASFFGYYYFFPDGLFESYYTYNNFEFRKVSGLWITEVYNMQKKVTYRLPLHYGPKELENISVGETVKFFPQLAYQFSGPKKIGATYVTYNPDINDSQISLAYYELSQHMQTALNIETLPAITHDVEKIENETIRTCNNTTEPIIYLSYANQTLVDFQKNCLILQGEGTELVKAVDRALYVFYGIMN